MKKEMAINQYSLKPLPSFVLRTSSFPCLCFCTISANIDTAKKGKKCLNIIMTITLSSWNPEKVSGFPHTALSITAALAYADMCNNIHRHVYLKVSGILWILFFCALN